ncbi:MAG: DUF1273 family protein [Clostridia bacterium]|nr:DUF1273 family protein [Clostridia bacterium]
MTEIIFRENACCFTGHRDLPEDSGELTEKLRKTVKGLIKKGVKVFYAGGARGFDTLAAKTVVALKEEYPTIKLVLVLPYRKGGKYEYVGKADGVEYVAEDYYRGCMFVRDRLLADMSAYCVCYLTEKRGGTAFTVGYAKNSGLTVINIAE